MPADNLPPDIIRILSFHGPVSWWAGGESALARGEAACAPFEDAIYLFLPVGSPSERALLHTNVMRLAARAPDGAYNLRMEGRATAGLPLARHPRRGELAPWAPDNVPQARLVVARFLPESIELNRAEGDNQTRHAGPTPAGKERPATGSVWARAALGGLAAPFGGLVVVGLWVFLALRGPEYPLRPVALMVSVVAGLLPLAGARLLMLASSFRRWRDGRAPDAETMLFEDALLAPEQVWSVGLRLALGGLVLLVLVAALWEPGLAGLAFALSGVWVLAPAWALHLSVAQPKR